MADNDVIRVVSATADKKFVILYKDDGDTIVIKQGDHRLNDLLDAIIPITEKGGVAEISLANFSVYKAFEKQAAEETGTVVKMFRVAKKALSSFFGGAKEDPGPKLKDVKVISPETVEVLRNKMRFGSDTFEPEPEAPQAPLVPEPIRNAAPSHITPVERHPVVEAPKPTTPPPAPAVQDNVPEPLKPHLKEVENDEHVTEDDTVVAIIDGVVIPGIEKIQPLIRHAVKHNSAIAVTRFLTRTAKMIEKRRHSVEDIMLFLEKGDLPLAEDGSIIAYKRLRSSTPEGTFVDVHSGNVRQRVGSYVVVDESLVDLNRGTECSNGLHIARRGYLHAFSGDVTVLCKIDPEDVVVVPHRDPNKVRVKGYHILAKLGHEAVQALNRNEPMTGDKGALAIVHQAIKGNHIARIEEVRVTQQMGRGLKITPLLEAGTQAQPLTSEMTEAEARIAAALDDTVHPPVNVDPREINKRINEVHTQTEETEQPEQTPVPEAELEEEAEAREEARIDEELLALTEEDKEALDEAHQGIVNALAHKPEPKKEETAPVLPTAQTPAAVAKAERAAKKKAKKQAPKQEPVKAPPPKAKAAAPKETAKPSTPGGKKSKAEEARALYDAGKLTELKAFKKAAKKGWDVLGFSVSEVEKILAP